MSSRSAIRKNRVARFGGFVVGVLLFYAPFALLVRGVGLLFPTTAAGTSVSDVHTACLRMPWGWLAQPWMWPTLGNSPISFLPVLVLPIAAVAAGPLFCGWLCPAGALPEHLGRLVPDRFKFDFKGRVDIVPLRYGFFVGFLLAPFISASICCAFCNFTHMQNLVSAVFGDISGFAYFTSLGVVAASLWIVPLGLFTKGGRGWCLFLCPAGTTMGLASSLTAKRRWARRVRTDSSACSSCGSCVDICPMRAVTLEAPVPADAVAQTAPAEPAGADEPALAAPDPTASSTPVINHHLCNECFDCVRGCSSGALTYRRPR